MCPSPSQWPMMSGALSDLIHPPVRATIDDEMIAASLLIIIWDLISEWITILNLRNVKYQI